MKFKMPFKLPDGIQVSVVVEAYDSGDIQCAVEDVSNIPVEHFNAKIMDAIFARAQEELGERSLAQAEAREDR